MIQAKFSEKTTGNIVSFEMTGHADFAEAGSDIVCAAASVLAQNTVNSIEQLAGYQPIVDIDDGYLYFEVLSDLSEQQQKVTNILLDSLLIGLQGIEEGYGDYIQVI